MHKSENTIRTGKVKSLFCSLFVLVAMGVMGVYVGAEAYATASTLTLTVGSSLVAVDVAPMHDNGYFKKSSNVAISAKTDNATGYTLKVAASNATDYDKLKNGSSEACNNAGNNSNSISGKVSSNCLNSINTAVPEATFSGLNNTGYNGLWGYLPSKYNSAANTDFRPAPDATGDILDVTSAANATNIDYAIAVGARVDSTMKIDTYSNTFVVELVGNAIPYSIVYDDNVVSNMPTDVASMAPGSTVTIENKTPTRAGYKFLGWCTVAPTSSSNGDTCGGTTYQPNGSFTLDQVTPANNDFYLYAMWEKVYTLQEFAAGTASTTCSAMSTGNTLKLIDSRDDQEYTIGKLADGKCWMTENLNLAGGTALSADDTDVTSAYISSFSTSNNLTKTGNTIVLPASATKNADNNNLTESNQFGTDNYSYVYNSGNKTNCGASGQNTPCYSYYSWDAATLGSGRNIATDNTDAAQSICPKGWKLPTSRTTSATNWQTTSDFYMLAHQYGLDSTTSTSESDNGFYTQAGPGTTPNFLLAGYYNSGSFSSGGSYGYYWSSTSGSGGSGARGLSFNSSYVNSAVLSSRRRGYSVRCLLQE